MKRRTVTALVLVCLLRAASVHAQSAQDFDTVFQQGVQLLERGQFAEAVVALDRARSMREAPAVLRNLAIARRGMGQFVEAAAALERYRQVAGDAIPQAIRTEVERQLNELNASIALASVQVDGSGAEVTIDARLVAPQDLGRPISLNPGSHIFRAAGDGLHAAEETRVVRPGERFQVRLSPERIVAPAMIRVFPSVVGATVRVDDRLLTSPDRAQTLSPGRHRVMVRAPDYEAWSTEIDVAPGQTQQLHVTLLRESRSVVRQWWFWTGLGVLVAGATTAILVTTLSAQEPPVPTTFNTTFMAVEGR